MWGRTESVRRSSSSSARSSGAAWCEWSRLIPDLLFGSNVPSALQRAGHEAVLVGDPTLERALPGDAVLVVDLTSDARRPADTVRGAPEGAVKTVAFYSHVEADVRARALGAGSRPGRPAVTDGAGGGRSAHRAAARDRAAA